MSIKKTIERFIFNFKQYLFSYKDGFFVLPYLANSPEAMVASFDRMPFVKKHKDANYITTSNSFFTGDCHYEELEQGLWLLVSNTAFKKNVSYDLIYDKEIPINYYFLSLYVSKSSKDVPMPMIHNVVNTHRAWTLFKPGSKAVNGHFAGSECIFFSVYFSQEWLDRSSKKGGLFAGGELQRWLDSDEDCLFLSELFEGAQKTAQPILDTILNKGEKGVQDILKLKIQTLELITSFLYRMREEKEEFYIRAPENATRRKILKAEKKLTDSIFEDFPGIEEIASDVGLSPSKLKSDFKSTYGKTLFQYFQFKQMETARDMILQNTEVKIVHVANAIGYQNASKFSAAFKKCMGYLPSEL